MKTVFRLLPVVAVCVSMLGACGGGGGGTSSAAGGQQLPSTSVAGTISGLGSVIVNGVRYETIGASVVDADDGTSMGTALGLGMTISIDPQSTNTSAAATIRVQSGIRGLTANINASAKTLSVAGLPVVADASTFIVTAAGVVGSFADLASGQPVEVYGLPQSDGSFKATRIEIETSVHTVQLVGAVANLNVANSTFTLGGASNPITVTFAGIALPTGLTNGAVVSVHTASTASASQYAATGLYLRAGDVTTFTQYEANYRGTSGVYNEANELYGMVSNLSSTSTGCTLQVQGVPATLGNTSLCASLRNGDYVEVKGLLVNGALTAYRVEFKTAGGDRAINGYQDDDNDSDHDGLKYHRQLVQTSSGSNAGESYELYGTLNCPVGAACTLTVNGTSWTADLSTAIWEHGRVSSGFVEAKGYMASADTFKVLKIEPKD